MLPNVRVPIHAAPVAICDPAGRFSAYIATAPENEAKARRALVRELVRFRRSGPTAAEVAEAKAHLTGRFVFDVETNGMRGETMLLLERYGLGLDYLARYPEEVAAVDVAAVRRVAARFLHPSRLATVVVGPEPGAPRGKR